MRGLRRSVWASALLACGICSANAAAAEIVWWNWDSPETAEAFRPTIEQFTRETGIQVRIERQDWAQLKEKLVVAIAGGVAPDVTSVSSNWFEELASQGAFEDLNPWLNRDTDKSFYSDIFKPSLQLWQSYDGRQFAMPFDNDIVTLFYNKELFNNAGLVYPDDQFTWDAWLQAAAKLTRDTDGDGQPDQYGMSNWWFYWYSLVWANGGEFFDANRTRLTLNTQAAREAIQFYAQFFPPQRNVLMVTADARRLGFPHPAAAWKAGKVGMVPAGAWMPTYWVWDNASNKWSFDFDVTHMPLSPKGQRSTTNEGQGMAILASSKNKEAAYRFVKWLAGRQVQTVAGQRGQFPIRRSVALSDAFLRPGQPPANKRVFVAAAEYARPYPKGVLWPKSSQVINAELNRYWTGQQGLDEALEKAAAAVLPILAQARGGR